jgi:hypothetical protein
VLAVLDANVLYSSQVRNLFLWCAVQGVYSPLWSQEIIDEVGRNIVRNGAMSPTQWNRLLRELSINFSDAWGTGYEGAAATADLPDEGDRHVIALAVHYEADVIVTSNRQHFPVKALAGFGIEPLGPAGFAKRLWIQAPEQAMEAALLHRQSLTRSRMSREAYVAGLRDGAGLRYFAQRLVQNGFLDTG